MEICLLLLSVLSVLLHIFETLLFDTYENSGEHCPYIYWFIIKDATQKQPNGRDAWSKVYKGEWHGASMPSAGVPPSQQVDVFTNLEALWISLFKSLYRALFPDPRHLFGGQCVERKVPERPLLVFLGISAFLRLSRVLTLSYLSSINSGVIGRDSLWIIKDTPYHSEIQGF